MMVKHFLCWLLYLTVIHVKLATTIFRRSFATKSLYPLYSDVFQTPDNCTALHINMVFRHGTRYPSAKDIKGINKMANFINQYFTKQTQYGDLTLPWVNRFYYGDKMLAQTGQEEMYNISKRLVKRFPSLFTQYFGERHYFVSTSTPRSSQSASAFAFGLFEGKGDLGHSKYQPVSIMMTTLSHPILRFFDACKKYEKEVSKNKKVSLKEFHQFQNGPEMEHVKKVIADRLNISGIITTDYVQHMFLSCAYEVAIYGHGQWCSIFDEDDLDIVEYLYDIKNYWKRGYGYKINYEISCLLLKNLTESVENAVKNLNKSHTLAIFHFSHAETVIPLLCILGLFNNTEPLQADNYHRQQDRQFKTSNMAPFSGNVAVVLYSCNNEGSLYFVQVLVNENVVGLPCCNNKQLCPLKQFLACFKLVNDLCDFSKMCSYNETEPHTEL